MNFVPMYNMKRLKYNIEFDGANYNIIVEVSFIIFNLVSKSHKVLCSGIKNSLLAKKILNLYLKSKT